MKKLIEDFFLKEERFVERKSLGQVKLVKRDILEKIAGFAGPDDVVIEIGGGEGNLTELLSKRAKLIICFEVDQRLKEKILDKIEFGLLLNMDFLSLPIRKIKSIEINNYKGDPQKIKEILNLTEKFKIVANIPFYISSKLIHKILSLDFFNLKGVHILVQREFSRKLCAKPGTEEYSAISAISNFFFDIKINFDVPRFYFRPIPNVHSSFISLIPKNTSLQEEKIRDFINFTYNLFQRKRAKIGEKRIYQITPQEIFNFFLYDAKKIS